MKPEKSKISVAVAAYRGEQFIAAQLQSLFCQTRQPDEIIISDDSPDTRTEIVVKQTAKEWSGSVIYSKNTEKKGIEENFRHAVRLCSGDIIFLCDQDDIWLPKKIEFLTQELEQYPDCQVIACNSKMVNSDLCDLGKTIPPDPNAAQPVFDNMNNRNAFYDILSSKIIIPGHAMAMKRTFRDIFLQMPPNMKYHDVWMAQTAALFEVIRYVNQELTLYRVHDKNASTPLKKKSRFGNLLRLKEIIQTPDDIAQTLFLLEMLYGLTVTPAFPVPEKNSVFLQNHIRYFQARQYLRSKKRPFRIFSLSRELWNDYFQIGTGWRALLRDQIL